MKVWTKAEDQYMRDHAQEMFADEMARRLGRSVQAVRKRAVDKKIRFRAIGKNVQSHQICWSCKWSINPIGNPCPWSSRFEPVEGWDADPVVLSPQGIHSKPIPSFRIRSCPLHEEG